MTSTVTREKRTHLQRYIARELESIEAVRGVIAIGSLATGQAHDGSDIDAIIFLDPYDEYIVPVEATWLEADNTYHSIFNGVDGIDIDLQRLDLAQWRDPAFEWPEPRRAELKNGWIAFDRDGEVTQLITKRTTYDEYTRIPRLDEAVTWLDQHLGGDAPHLNWENLGPAIAHDRLNAAYFYLVQALFALNRRWRPWRNREMSVLLALPWLPDDFNNRVLHAVVAPAHDYAGYMSRVEMLRALFRDVLAKLQNEGLYGDDPVGEAFIRSHDDMGRAWNIAEWETEHRRRYGE